jgi:hypothetical protein
MLAKSNSEKQRMNQVAMYRKKAKNEKQRKYRAKKEEKTAASNADNRIGVSDHHTYGNSFADASRVKRKGRVHRSVDSTLYRHERDLRYGTFRGNHRDVLERIWKSYNYTYDTDRRTWIFVNDGTHLRFVQKKNVAKGKYACCAVNISYR